MTVTDAHVAGGIEIGGSAPFSFVHGSGPALSQIVVEWDFDNDGDFDEDEENITGFFVEGESVSGRDKPSDATGKAQVGDLRLLLRNDDDRFSMFNTASPLNQAPFSLASGRKIRVRTAESVPDDPVLLARDRFVRPDGPLGTTETGETWTPRLGSWQVRSNVAAAGPFFGDPGVLETFDVGASEHYVQATLRQVKTSPARNIGICIRFSDVDNYTLVYINTTTGVVILDRDGGVNAALGTDYEVQPWEGMTLGAGYRDGVVTAYIGGVPVRSGTPTSPDGSGVGVFCNYGNFTGRSPEIGDFHVWDHVATEVEGILWSGDVVQVLPRVRGANKTAEVRGEGVLARAAGAGIASPRLPVAGAATGLVVGDVLARARLLNPPQPLAEGTVTTGPIGVADGDALTLARQVEETERGFLHETNEGKPGYDDRAARGDVPVQAWFSDAEGAQFGYSVNDTQLLDHRSLIINRVTAGVAAEAPAGISVVNRNSSGHVDVLLPTTAAGDLVVVFIASSITTSINNWNAPLWWTEHRQLRDALGMRIYSHPCDGTESGDTIRFFTNSGPAAGLWVAQVWRIQDWFESGKGVAIGDLVRGADPGPLVHGWGRVPTLFIVTRTGIGSGSGGTVDPNFNPPDGYSAADFVLASSGVFSFDVGIASAFKIDCTESEDPTPYNAMSGYTIDESVVFAVRGFNGPHSKATLDNPETVGGTGQFVTVDDVASQDRHNMVRTHPAPSNLFASESDAEAYGDAIVAGHAEDRPRVQITFVANTTAAYRQQAIRRRLSDKIYLEANNRTGLGVDGGAFIESIRNRWSAGGTRWDVTWQLSPA